jgi:hypothetical protein
MHLPKRSSAATLLLAVLLLDIPATSSAMTPLEQAEFFERKVRPVLVEKCFSCHGPSKPKAGLKLTSRESLLSGGDSGPAAVPGKPDESLLIKVVNYNDDIQMPPDGPLDAQEVAVLKKWVELGIPWPENSVAVGSAKESGRSFWSFQPVREPVPPAVQQTDWPRRPLDRFVLSRLEQEGLQPVHEADRRTLIRRATFDLLGLPPSYEEVEAFVADDDPNAYEHLIERLLASPHYGERWARHWLDVARYGEDQAHTFQARLYPNAFRYRDWVVQAFNDDLPYDQFVAEQIAGDLLPGEDRLSRLPALGFFALGPVYYADAGCAPKAKADEYDDRIDTLCRGILGLTVSCARCHDHKFDPIPTTDYYALAGVFSSTEYLEAPLVDARTVKAYDDAQAKIKQAEERLKQQEAEESRRVGESLAPHTAECLMTAWRIQNRRKIDPAYKTVEAVQGTALPDYLIDRWLQFLASDPGQKNLLLAPWQELVRQQDAKQDLAQDEAVVSIMQRSAAAIQDSLLAAIQQRRDIEQEFESQTATAKDGDKSPEKRKLPQPTVDLLKEFFEKGNAPFALPKDRVNQLLSNDAKAALESLKKQVEEIKKQSPPKYPFAHSLTEGKAANAKVQVRGNPKELGDEVPRHFLTVLSPPDSQPFQQGSGRLELARAIASEQNPLTARVFVNRVWQHHFGRGIVGTPSNFGLLGERPTHPELLDYLASRFMASGWSVKQLHRDIMLAATYRLASTSNAKGNELDPDNRLLWRMNRRRLDVEAWRDAVLATSGELDRSLGGPSQNVADANHHRRTLYAAVSRHNLNPMLRLFDFPDPNLTSERRVVTTVPMQQLFVLNGDFIIRQSQALVARLDRENLTSDEARVERLYQLAYARPPSEQDRRLAREFLERPLPDGISVAEVKLTRWQQYAQALLSANEFTFVD